MTDRILSSENWAAAQRIWDYHHMGHELRRCSVAIGLGSHDLGVATTATELYVTNLFPLIVFSGGNSPTTATRFPRGEAVHYRDHAVESGVPGDAVLVEPNASNTGENIEFSRKLLLDSGVDVDSVMLISKPYMQRRAFATCRATWPEVQVICASEKLQFDDYVESLGNPDMVVDMVVGDLQRIMEYPKFGFAISQDIPADVDEAYRLLVHAGFTRRLINSK